MYAIQGFEKLYVGAFQPPTFCKTWFKYLRALGYKAHRRHMSAIQGFDKNILYF